jgi:hypothetical protein
MNRRSSNLCDLLLSMPSCCLCRSGSKNRVLCNKHQACRGCWRRRGFGQPGEAHCPRCTKPDSPSESVAPVAPAVPAHENTTRLIVPVGSGCDGMVWYVQAQGPEDSPCAEKYPRDGRNLQTEISLLRLLTRQEDSSGWPHVVHFRQELHGGGYSVSMSHHSLQLAGAAC